MKRYSIISFFLLSTAVSAQPDPELIVRVDSMLEMAQQINEEQLDSSIAIAKDAVLKAKDGNYLLGAAKGYDRLGYFMDRKIDFKKGIEYYKESVRIKERIGEGDLAWTYGEIGYCQRMLGYPDSAIYYYEKGRALGRASNDTTNIALQGLRVGYVFLDREDLERARSEFEISLSLGEQINNHFVKAEALGGLHKIYAAIGDHYKAHQIAMRYLDESYLLGDRRLITTAYRLMGQTNQELGNNFEAKKDFLQAIEVGDSINARARIGARLDLAAILLEEDSAHRALELIREAEKAAKYNQMERSIAVLKGYEAQALMATGQLGEANRVANEALEKARNQEGWRIRQRPLKVLWQINKALGKHQLALNYHEQLIAVTDSINNEDFAKTMLRAELEQTFKVQLLEDSISNSEERYAQQLLYESKVSAEKGRRNVLIFAGSGLLLLSFGLWSRLNYTRKAKSAIQREKDISEELLLNILPEEIARELKVKGHADARDFDQVSILFTDFKGFTEASGKMNAQDLVSEINTCFKAFDQIIGKYGVEKIKTIGDAYMAAGGLPVPAPDAAKNTVLTALEMQDFITRRKAEMDTAGKPAFEMRVGVHTGPVVAGIVGVKKFQYDVWGDTVNTASRIESSGEVGKVNISQATYDLIKDAERSRGAPLFKFTPRGKVQAKGKGELDMYFVAKA